MSVEALWIARFGGAAAPQIIRGHSNAGVVVLESGRLFGGDALYYYLGNYTTNGQTVSATAKIVHFNGPVLNAFGTQQREYEIVVEGTLDRDTITATMHQTTNPGRRIPIIFERKANLP
jgi:hypothetical protein